MSVGLQKHRGSSRLQGVSTIIIEFVRRYVREQDFFARVAELCGRRLERLLRDESVRAITTWRAKRPDRLQKKLEDREIKRIADGKSPFQSDVDIYNDVPDLAGARVALYFPDERAVVRRLIAANFVALREPRSFPIPDSELDATALERRSRKRFPGYAAEHYRVRLSETDLSPDEKRYAEGRCEIQVASVLMHAWAEVEHDLEYKDLSGAVSDAESALLDQINGLVIAGEIALEQLHSATRSRTEVEGVGSLRDHYDLAIWLGSLRSSGEGNEASTQRSIGRADLAYRLLQLLGRTSISSVAPLAKPIRDVLGTQADGPPIADIMVDVLIEAEPEVASLLHRAKAEVAASELSTVPSPGASAQVEEAALGKFLTKWGGLERVIALLRPEATPSVRGPSNFTRILSAFTKAPDALDEIKALQDLRSRSVHGRGRTPTASELYDGVARIESLVQRLPALADSPELKAKLEEAISVAMGTEPAVQEEMPIEAGPAFTVNSKNAVAVPFVFANRSPEPDTVTKINLEIGTVSIEPSMPPASLLLSDLEFRVPGTGIRLGSWDSFRCALYFSDVPGLAGVGNESLSFVLRVDTVRRGSIRVAVTSEPEPPDS